MQLKNNLSYGLSLIAAVCLSACGADKSAGRAELKDSVVGARAVPGAIELGYGYSEKTGKFIRTQCVQGTTSSKNLADTGGNVSFIVDGSYQKIVDALSGSLDVSLNLAVIKASAGASIAKSVASSELTTNIVAYKTLVGKAEFLPSSTTTYAPAVLDLGSQTEQYCGTDYVSEIDYGASMVVSLEVIAKSKQQKEKIAGYLQASFAEIVEGRGSLEIIDENERQDYRVRLMINQVGGVPQNVALAVPEDGLYCSVDDLRSCLAKMNAAITYMRGQWRSDLFEIQNWNPVNYHTTSYSSNARVKNLAPVKLTAAQKTLLATAYDSIKREYDELSADLRDANVMMESGLLDSEKRQLSPVLQTILGNLRKLDRAINECLDNFDYCLDVAADLSQLKLVPFNEDFRRIGYERRAQYFCSQLLTHAFASGELTDGEILDLKREKGAPVFADPKNSSSKVIGSAPCLDVFEASLAD